MQSSVGESERLNVAGAYPEPYAIRRYLPNTPLALTASALSNASTVQGASPISTTERRAAIPVPGRGELMSDANTSAKGGLAGIPVQAVGVGGDPYRTAMVNATSDPVTGSKLPLPNPAEMLLPSASASSLKQTGITPTPKGFVARKGGDLLQTQEADAKANREGARVQVGVQHPPVPSTDQLDDKSFVF